MREVVVSYLKAAGHSVAEAADGASALVALKQQPADLIILDPVLPGVDDLEVCRRLRDEGNDVRVIMSTALGTEQDRVVGLEIGVDDYVTRRARNVLRTGVRARFGPEVRRWSPQTGSHPQARSFGPSTVGGPV